MCLDLTPKLQISVSLKNVSYITKNYNTSLIKSAIYDTNISILKNILTWLIIFLNISC